MVYLIFGFVVVLVFDSRFRVIVFVIDISYLEEIVIFVVTKMSFSFKYKLLCFYIITLRGDLIIFFFWFYNVIVLFLEFILG